MKKSIVAAAVLLCNTGFSQKILTNNEPVVSIDAYRKLFIGLDNPVTISTGGYDNVVLEIKNGTLKHVYKGNYLITPGYDESYVTILKMKTPQKTYEFVFQVRDLPDPELRLAGQPNEDGVVFFKTSKGLRAVLPDFCYETAFNVQSFDVSFSGEGFEDTVLHTNVGAAWDSTSKVLIDRCKPGSSIVINHAYFIGPDGRLKKHYDEMRFILH